MPADNHVQCVVVGAGVVGLAVAAELARRGMDVLVLEQHDIIGSETSSRNSEVIHAGIYYPQNSLKAALCVAGKHLLYRHCDEFAVPYKRVGKLIVAVAQDQVDTVRGYINQAAANGVDDLRWLSGDEIRAIEPQVQAVGGVLSPSTGIVDAHALMLSLQGELERCGGQIAFLTKVTRLFTAGGNHRVQTADFELSCDWLINAAGLSAPSLTSAWEIPVIPYYAKGHYYTYSGVQPFSRLIYPVAEPGGLGVHVTLDLAGQVKFGPDVQWVENVDYSFDRANEAEFARAISAYFPGLDKNRLYPGYTGIRPKLVGRGQPAADFRLAGPDVHGFARRIDLLGIESPGLTASLAIAQRVGQMVLT